MSKKHDWSVETAALASDDFRLAIPLAAMLYEAKELGEFVRSHQKADKKTGLPGLESAKVSVKVADEIDSLVSEASAAQNAYNLTVDAKTDAAKLDRARFIVEEIHSVMAYFLDDGVEDEDDARLANVVGAHKDEAETPATLALSLEDYAALASLHEKEIHGLGGFDGALIKEARGLADDLRKRTPAAPSPASAAALAKRNRLLQLLDARVRKVRSATKFVFRAHPEVVRKVASAYERKRRIDAKRAATRKKNAEPVTAPVTPAPHA